MKNKKNKIIGIIFSLLGIIIISTLFYLVLNERIFNKENLLPGPLTSKEEKSQGVLSNDKIIKITNEYRGNENLLPLGENEILNKAAMERVEDMFKQQYFAHVSPDGKDISDTLELVHYEYAVSGENLALGYFADSKDLVDAWMASEGHRANILNSKFTEIGVAHKIGLYEGKKQYIAVQVFGKPMADCFMPDENLKEQISLEKKEVAALEKRLDNLKGEINLLEAKIEENNKKKKELQSLQAQLEEKVDYYNNLVGQLKTKQVSLQKLIIQYNDQVDTFNQCVKN
ncbi:MAG: CAP domain-containing protein [Candidatus Pacebacteria bacterium]|nr:CAP domain-containing protein [Candidatus Paceibacterota bacterium]